MLIFGSSTFVLDHQLLIEEGPLTINVSAWSVEHWLWST